MPHSHWTELWSVLTNQRTSKKLLFLSDEIYFLLYTLNWFHQTRLQLTRSLNSSSGFLFPTLWALVIFLFQCCSFLRLLKQWTHLQRMDGDGAAPPGVQMTDCIHCCRTAKQHEFVEQLLLWYGEPHLEHAFLCGRADGLQAGFSDFQMRSEEYKMLRPKLSNNEDKLM